MIVLFSWIAKTQIKKPGFEEPQVDTIAHWKVLPQAGYTRDAHQYYFKPAFRKVVSVDGSDVIKPEFDRVNGGHKK